MSFFNALAWFSVAWFVIWFAASAYRLGTERNATLLAATYAAVSRRAPFMFGALVLSVLWLIFG